MVLLKELPKYSDINIKIRKWSPIDWETCFNVYINEKNCGGVGIENEFLEKEYNEIINKITEIIKKNLS